MFSESDAALQNVLKWMWTSTYREKAYHLVSFNNYLDELSDSMLEIRDRLRKYHTKGLFNKNSVITAVFAENDN